MEQQRNGRGRAAWSQEPRARCRRFPSGQPTRETEQQSMIRDRIKGAAEQAKGKVKEQAGKLTGD
jgi:hypothetical protein